MKVSGNDSSACLFLGMLCIPYAYVLFLEAPSRTIVAERIQFKPSQKTTYSACVGKLSLFTDCHFLCFCPCLGGGLDSLWVCGLIPGRFKPDLQNEKEYSVTISKRMNASYITALFAGLLLFGAGCGDNNDSNNTANNNHANHANHTSNHSNHTTPFDAPPSMSRRNARSTVPTLSVGPWRSTNAGGARSSLSHIDCIWRNMFWERGRRPRREIALIGP